MKELLADHPLYLLVLLPSRPSDAFLKELEQLSRFKNWFSGLNLILYLCTDAPEFDQGAIGQMLGFPITFCKESLDSLARLHSCTQIKPVFGTERAFAFSSLVLYEGHTLLLQTRRINSQAIEKVLRTALKVQSKRLKEQLSSSIDT